LPEYPQPDASAFGLALSLIALRIWHCASHGYQSAGT